MTVVTKIEAFKHVFHLGDTGYGREVAWGGSQLLRIAKGDNFYPDYRTYHPTVMVVPFTYRMAPHGERVIRFASK